MYKYMLFSCNLFPSSPATSLTYFDHHAPQSKANRQHPIGCIDFEKMASSNVHPYANHILRDGNHSQRLEDVPLLRRLMVELSYMLTTVDTPQDMEAMRNLPSLFRSQEQIIGNIMRAVQTDRSHTVLLQASLRFVAARHEGDEAILAATNELVTLASAPVLTNGAEHEEEYQAASRLLDERGVDVTLTDTELFSIVSINNVKLIGNRETY